MGLKFFVLIALALLALQAVAPVSASDIVVIGADTIHNVTTTYPSDIPDVTPRIIVEYAESNSYIPLTFPLEFMNDSIPPVIADVSVINVTNNSVVITWRTDEFTDSVVKYGENSTVYTKMCTDELFVKELSLQTARI